MNKGEIFPLTSTKPQPINRQRVHYPAIKTASLIKAEKKNKHLVKLLSNKIFTGYRQMVNGPKYLQKFKDKLKYNNREDTYYPFQEEYEAIYKHKYLKPLNTKMNWNRAFAIKKITFNSAPPDEPQGHLFSNRFILDQNLKSKGDNALSTRHVYCQTYC